MLAPGRQRRCHAAARAPVTVASCRANLRNQRSIPTCLEAEPPLHRRLRKEQPPSQPATLRPSRLNRGLRLNLRDASRPGPANPAERPQRGIRRCYPERAPVPSAAVRASRRQTIDSEGRTRPDPPLHTRETGPAGLAGCEVACSSRGEPAAMAAACQASGRGAQVVGLRRTRVSARRRWPVPANRRRPLPDNTRQPPSARARNGAVLPAARMTPTGGADGDDGGWKVGRESLQRRDGAADASLLCTNLLHRPPRYLCSAPSRYLRR